MSNVTKWSVFQNPVTIVIIDSTEKYKNVEVALSDIQNELKTVISSY